MQNADQSQRAFRRIIWAPKILDAGEPSAGPAVERDPLQALQRCDKQIGADKIDGDILSKFVEYLFQYLVETAPRPVAGEPGETSSRSISPITAPTKTMPGDRGGAARRTGQNPNSGV